MVSFAIDATCRRDALMQSVGNNRGIIMRRINIGSHIDYYASLNNVKHARVNTSQGRINDSGTEHSKERT